jgi:hypothetical protein
VRVLEKAGFTREGYARQYLCINGAWQDHLTFAMLAEDVRRADSSSTQAFSSQHLPRTRDIDSDADV